MKDILNKVRSGLTGRNEVMRNLYKDAGLITKARNYILSNGGREEDALELRTEAIIAFIKRCYHPEFELKGNIEGYLLTIVKNNWMRKMKRLKREREIEVDDQREDVENSLLTIERKGILKKAMQALDEKCNKMMLLWSQNLRMREIAIRMEYKSEGMARKKKYECMQRLKTLFEKYE